MTTPLIIPIFIMQRGCVHRCIYCHQQKTVGPYPEDITPAFFRQTIENYLQNNRMKSRQAQLAFYGGNFTGMPRKNQLRLLEYAQPFRETGHIGAIRISTRPDCIDQESIDLIKGYGVQIVEIGAQSLIPAVLKRAKRGHTVQDVEAAVGLLKKNGLHVGIHLMAGLPGDDAEGFARSVAQTIALKPEMVRIHPTIVFSETGLEQEYLAGNYTPLTLDAALTLCKSAMLQFAAAGICVIRVGLQTTPQMEKPGTVVAGPYHVALRFLVEASIFFDRASSLLSAADSRGKQAIFSVCPRDEANLRGSRNENIHNLQALFGLSSVRIRPEVSLPPGELHVRLE